LPAESGLPLGAVCRTLTLVRWEFAGCRNPDGGPVEIGWATGQTTCLDTSPSGDLTIRAATLGDIALADGGRAAFRHLAPPAMGAWWREPVGVGHPLAVVLGQTLIGVRRVVGGRGRPERIVVRFTGGAALAVAVFRAEVVVEVVVEAAVDAADVTTYAPPSSPAKHVHRGHSDPLFAHLTS